ncbi:MAG TPA: AAA family ATPase [Candidatus Limnocylindria bacterium]|nr:AAA family ATPase [Candidatus Limnocylindria bacterium]
MSVTGRTFGTHTPYLGREAEIERLGEHLSAAMAGHGRLVLLRGAGGMGLTRTAHEVAARGDRLGMLVLWGTSREGLTGRPYGGLAEALEEYGSGLEPEQLAAQLGSGAPYITRLAPRLRMALKELTPAAPLPAADERLRLQAAVLGWLKRASAEQPLLLVLDDAQWADGDELRLLDYLGHRATDLPLLLLVNELRLPPLPEQPAESDREVGLRDELAAEVAAEVIELGGLDERSTGALLDALAGQRVPAPAARLVWEVSGGEPLWARELYRHLHDEGRSRSATTTAETLPTAEDLPSTFEELVRWRMSRLAPEARAALTALAAFPHGAEPALVARVTGSARGGLIGSLEEGVEAGLCRRSAQGHLYAIAHDLLRLALLGATSGAQRGQLARRVAQALEETLGDATRERAGELLHHYRLSAALEEAERGLRHGLLTAEQARAAYAQLRAVECLRASRLLVAGSNVRTAAELGGRIAQAQAEAGLIEEALASAAGALGGRREPGQPIEAALEQLIEVLRVARGNAVDGAPPAQVEAARRQGLEHSSRLDAAGRARLELLVEGWQPMAVEQATALAWNEAPDSVARELVDGGQEADLAELLLPQRARRRDESARAAGHARTWRRPAAVLRAMRAVATDLLTRHGLFREGTSWAALYAAAARRYGSPRDRLAASLLLVRGQATLGDFPAAQEALAEADELLADIQQPGWAVHDLLLAKLVVANYLDGDWQALCERLDEARFDPSPQALPLSAELCLAHVRAGLAERARELLPAVLEACAALPPMSYLRDAATVAALAAAWEMGAGEHSAAADVLLDGMVGADVGTQPAGSPRMARARSVGLMGGLAEVSALLDRDRPSLEEAGLRPLRAIADHDDGLLLAAGGPAERVLAPPLLERAARQFEELGMAGWARRTAELLERGLDAARTPGGRLHFTYPAGLSQREVELVRLLAGGESLDAAALTLGLEEAVARRHLDSALKKLDIGLAELPRAVRRHGIGSSP